MKRIVIFASGSGSNAQRIVEYFSGTDTACVAKIFSNRADAHVLQRARNLNIPAVVFGKSDLYETGTVYARLKSMQPELIVLAGFLWKVPKKIIQAFPKRIINIHPALLPKYGGKGMYGSHVHEAVVAAGEKESGITIHHVNENYDEGQVIFQAKCPVFPSDSPDAVAVKVHALEYEHFPRVIGEVVANG